MQTKSQSWLRLPASIRQVYRQAGSGKRKALGFSLMLISKNQHRNTGDNKSRTRTRQSDKRIYTITIPFVFSSKGKYKRTDNHHSTSCPQSRPSTNLKRLEFLPLPYLLVAERLVAFHNASIIYICVPINIYRRCLLLVDVSRK